MALILTGIFGFSVNVKANENPMAYPNVQSYQKDDNEFTIGSESRLYVIADEKTLNNETLLKDLKLTSNIPVNINANDNPALINFFPFIYLSPHLLNLPTLYKTKYLFHLISS